MTSSSLNSLLRNFSMIFKLVCMSFYCDSLPFLTEESFYSLLMISPIILTIKKMLLSFLCFMYCFMFNCASLPSFVSSIVSSIYSNSLIVLLMSFNKACCLKKSSYYLKSMTIGSSENFLSNESNGLSYCLYKFS